MFDRVLNKNINTLHRTSLKRKKIVIIDFSFDDGTKTKICQW